MKPPNILFLFPDQHRWDWLGLNPDLPCRTPNLDTLAARGLRFERCYTPSPLCSPARACLATGRCYGRSGVESNRDNTPTDLPTHTRALREAGYQVAGVGKFDLHKADQSWGLDGKELLEEYGYSSGCDNEGKGDGANSYLRNGRQPAGPYLKFLADRGWADAYVDMFSNATDKKSGLNFTAVSPLPEQGYCDNWIAGNAAGELRDFDGDRPWYLVVNFAGPHDPYDVTACMHAAWNDVEFPEPWNAEPEEGVMQRRRNYAAMIEIIDTRIGELIRIVEERGELDNTLIVYSSDHGEMLGDHNRWTKKVWQEGSSHVPLILAGPGVAEGQSTGALTSLHDLSATFLELAGAPELEGADARSFCPTLKDPTRAHRQIVTSALGDWRMAVDRRYKCVTTAGKPTLLFDLAVDPAESNDIADKHPGLVEEMTAFLEDEYGPLQVGTP
jgi:arylsulfatase A-like enzyme